MNSYADVDGVPAVADALAAHRGAARRVGLRPARWCPTTGPCRSSRRCTASPRTTPTPAARARRRHRRRTARHDRLRPGAGRAGRRGDVARGAGRPRRAAGADPEGRARAARPRLDAGGVGGRRGRPRPRPAGATGRSRARWPSGRSCCSTPGPPCPCSGRAGRRCADRRRRPVRRRPAHASSAATPSPTTCCRGTPASGLGVEVPTAARRPARGAARRRGRARARAATCGDPTVGLRRGGRGRAGARRLRRIRRRPGRAVRPRAPRARAATPRTCGCPASRPTSSPRCSATGTPVVVVVVSGRPYALGDGRGRAAGLVQAFMPGEEGGAAIAGVLSGRVQPGGRLPVQIPRHAGRPAVHLPAAAAGRRGHGHQQPRPDPAVPVRVRALLHHVRRSTARTSPTPSSRPTVRSTVGVRVRNTGARAGSEVVQLYLRDVRGLRDPAGPPARRVRPGAARAGRGGRRPLPAARRPDCVHRPRPAARRRAR